MPIAALTRDDAARPRDHQSGTEGGAGSGDHPGGLPRPAGARSPRSSWRCSSAASCRRRWSLPVPSTAPIGCGSSWFETASRRSGFTATGRNRSGPRRWPGSRAGNTGCWSRPTSRAARDRHRGAGSRGELRCAEGGRRLHPPGGPHGAGGSGGDAFTFVAPDEEGDLRNIERAIGRRLPRVIVPDFGITRPRPEARLEVPLEERLSRNACPKEARSGREGTPRRHARSTGRAKPDPPQTIGARDTGDLGASRRAGERRTRNGERGTARAAQRRTANGERRTANGARVTPHPEALSDEGSSVPGLDV